MPCIEPLHRASLPGPRRAAAWIGAALLALLAAGCGHVPPPAAPAPGATPASPTPRAGEVGEGARAALPPPGAALPARRPPRPARHWEEFQVQAAQRLVEANPDATYLGEVPEPLLAIPVLEIELNGDGSVRRIEVKRKPRQALDTVDLAIAAVRRAAPFGPVSHLPRPWKFTEVFLFDEQRRFKPRTLDL